MCKNPDKCAAVKSFDDLCQECLDDYAFWLSEQYEAEQEYYEMQMQRLEDEGMREAELKKIS
jgi:hypothetical protein